MTQSQIATKNTILTLIFYHTEYKKQLYWNVFETQTVRGQLAAKFHYTEGRVLSEQLFTLRASIGSDQPRKRKMMIWDLFNNKKANSLRDFNL